MSAFALPISITMGLVIYGLIARWYLWPWMRRVSFTEAVTPILLFHSFRYIGIAFFLTGVTAEPLDPRFADPAVYGDFAAAVLALVSVVLLRNRFRIAIPLIWLFSVVGLGDMVNALYQGLQHVPDAAFGATYFIPALLVPALVVSHILVFVMLFRRVHPRPTTT